MKIAPMIMHLVYLMQIFFFITDVSQSVTKAFVFVVVLFVFMAVMLRNSVMDVWKIKSLRESGIIFLGYYSATLALGFVYGHSFTYVAVNLMWILPLFLVLLVPRDFDVKSVLNIVLFYAAITAGFSIVELLAWQDIGWLSNYVAESYDEYGRSKIFNEKTGIKAFGFFPNAVSNGLLLILGVIILLERACQKFTWGRFAGIFLFVTIILFTYTRNNYLVLLCVFGASYLIHRFPSLSFDKGVWRLSILFYFTVLAAAIIFTLLSYGGLSIDEFESGNDSVQSRVVSWGLILVDYLFSNLSSFHIWVGYGFTQLENEFSPEKTYWAIDNSLLMVFLGSGLVGCFLFFSWLKSGFQMLQRVHDDENVSGRTNVRIVVLALVAYFVCGLMNATVLSTEVLLPLLLVLSRFARQEGKLKKRSLMPTNADAQSRTLLDDELVKGTEIG